MGHGRIDVERSNAPLAEEISDALSTDDPEERVRRSVVTHGQGHGGQIPDAHRHRVLQAGDPRPTRRRASWIHLDPALKVDFSRLPGSDESGDEGDFGHRGEGDPRGRLDV